MKPYLEILGSLQKGGVCGSRRLNGLAAWAPACLGPGGALWWVCKISCPCKGSSGHLEVLGGWFEV